MLAPFIQKDKYLPNLSPLLESTGSSQYKTRFIITNSLPSVARRKLQPHPTLHDHGDHALLQLQRNPRLGALFQAKILHQVVHDRLDLHQCKPGPDAVPRTHSERQVRGRVDLGPVLFAETLRIEPVRIREVLRVMVQGSYREPDDLTLFDRDFGALAIVEEVVLDAVAIDEWSWRP